MADEKIKLSPDIEQLAERLFADPKSRVFAQLADAYRKGGMFDEAIDTAKRGLEIHPTYAIAHMVLGRCYMAKKMYALAREEFELTVKNDPQSLVGFKLLAETYEKQNMIPEAVKYYQMVMDLEPDIDIADKIDALKATLKKTASPEPTLPPLPPEPAPQPISEQTPVAAEPIQSQPTTAEEPPAPVEIQMPEVLQEPAAEAAKPEEPIAAAVPPAPETAPEAQAIEIPLPESPTPAPEPQAAEPQAPAPAAEEPQPGTTTLAELYASQGHHEKAIEIYKELIAAEPDNQAYKDRMDALLDLAFPDMAVPQELELPEAKPEPAREPTPQPSSEKAPKPVEAEGQAEELTGMIAEMERLTSVASPQEAPTAPKPAAPELSPFDILETPKPAEVPAAPKPQPEPVAESLSFDGLFSEGEKKDIGMEPAAPAAPPVPEALPAAEAKATEPPAAENTEEPKEDAVSSFQSWLNTLQK